MKMKCVFALLGVLMITAAFGTGPAAATTLCESKLFTCPMGERYTPLPQKLQAALTAKTNWALTYGEVTITCNESKLAAEAVKDEGIGKRLKVEIGTLSLGTSGGKCQDQTGTVCTENEWVSLPYIEAGITPSMMTLGNGTFKIDKAARVAIKCEGVKCVYDAEPLEFELIGGAAGLARLVAKSVTMSKDEIPSALICNKTASLSFDYTITTPAKAVWVSSEP
jgi:hypothetical protein